MIIQALMYPVLMWRVQEMGQLRARTKECNWRDVTSSFSFAASYRMQSITNRQVGGLKCAGCDVT